MTVTCKNCYGTMVHCYSCPNIDSVSDTICVDLITNNEIKIAERQLRCICFLCDRINHVVTKEELINHVWEKQAVGQSSLPVLICDIRTIISSSPLMLKTVRGVGYILIDRNRITE